MAKTMLRILRRRNGSLPNFRLHRWPKLRFEASNLFWSLLRRAGLAEAPERGFRETRDLAEQLEPC